MSGLNWLEQKGFLYDAIDGSSGSSAGTGESASTSSAPDTPAPAQSTTAGFTQDDVNKVAAKARTEGKQAALKALLEELGLDTPDTLKTLVKTAKEQEAAQMSEADKLRKELEKAQADAKAKDIALAEKEQSIVNDRRDNAVRTALLNANVRKDDAEDAFILMRERGMLATLIGDDGKLNTKAVEEVVAKFKTEKPVYFAPTSPGSPSNTGGRAPAPDQKDAEKAARGQRNAMRNW